MRAPPTVTEAIAEGMYVIMRKLHGYRIEHFQKESFYASQYFALLELINLEEQIKEKDYKKAERESKRR